MSQVNVANSTLSFQVLDGLHWIATPALTVDQQQQIRQALLSRTDNWQGQPYSELRGKLRMMRRVTIPTSTRIQEGARWAQAGGQLSAVPAQDIPEAYLYFVTAPLQPVFGSFSVHWQGQVTAPQTGNYTFSISPINVNSPDAQNPLQLTVTLNVGGNAVFTANATQWNRSSTPVSLTAGQPVALALDWSAQVSQRFPNRALHALLYWSGPSVANSIIPQAALSLPDGSAAGLQTTYTWTNSNGQQTLTRTEPNIDVLWTSVHMDQQQRPADAHADRTEHRCFVDLASRMAATRSKRAGTGRCTAPTKRHGSGLSVAIRDADEPAANPPVLHGRRCHWATPDVSAAKHLSQSAADAAQPF
jgi:hypothetical protein